MTSYDYLQLANIQVVVKMDSVSLLNNMDSVNLKVKQKRTAGQKHGDLKMELLKEGLTLLDAQGVEGVTIRAVAR